MNSKYKYEGMEGDGPILSTIANLAMKAISHLLPGLLSKGGEKVGEVIGDLVGSKIKDLHTNMTQSGNGTRLLTVDGGKRKYSKVVSQKASSYLSGLTPGNFPLMDGEGTKLAGTGTKLAGKGTKLAGRGTRLAGKRSENVVRFAGKSHLQMDEMVGTGVMKMTGNGPNEKLYRMYYNKCLKNIVKVVGDSTTNNTMLDNLGKYLFGTKYGGAIPSDKIKDINKDKYYVANYDNSTQEGSHWVAICDGHIYDSLSTPKELLEEYNSDYKKKGLKYVSKTMIQDPADTNCGQHAIAFLLLHHKYGSSVFNVM